jgi:protein-S-isoprenylcysteine O-methyltransferase Ste14
VPLGFALSAAYLLLARPTPPLLALGGAIALGGVALRGWAAGYLEKGTSLATGGPYAFTRNPLYLGSSLIGAGFAVAGRSAAIAAAFAALLVLIYLPVIRREERFLKQKFGSAYDEYARGTPLFWPRPWRWVSSSARFRWALYRKNREYEAALGFVAGMCLVALKLALMPG